VTLKDPINNRPKGFSKLWKSLLLQKLLSMVAEYNNNTV